jgi:diguanylate cyclase (GGDEF)-like protein/PAS domain S-box-containing protein
MTRDDTIKAPLAGGQTLRLSGGSRDAGVHDQLYRYAEDLQQMIERQGALEARYEELQDSCTRLTESRATLDELIRSSRDIHIFTDPTGLILQCNPAIVSIAAAHHLAGENLAAWVKPESRSNLQAMLQSAVTDADTLQEIRELQIRRATHDAAHVIVSAQVMPIRKQSGLVLHWIMRDITHERENAFESQISSMVFKSTIEGVMITDVDGDILAVNPSFTRITGYSADEVVGRNPRFLQSGIQGADFYAELWSSILEKGSWQGEVYNRKKDGEVYPEWLAISAARDTDGNVLSYIGVFSDLTRLLQTEKRLAYLAHHDSLTGLPNRLLFQDRLEQLFTQGRRSHLPFTVIFIDLDHFKQVNDTLGHEVGDKVLIETGQRLANSVREVDTVARLGGDEFVILAPTLTGKEDITRLCAKLLTDLSQPIHSGSQILHIGGSFGSAEYPLNGDDAMTLLRHADRAMYQAKAAGGNQHVIYCDDEAV